MQHLLFFYNNVSLVIGFQSSIIVSLTIINKDIFVNDIHFTIMVCLIVRIKRHDIINIYTSYFNLLFDAPMRKDKLFLLLILSYNSSAIFVIRLRHA